MGLRHRVARALVGTLPDDRGLWRMRSFLPACPNPSRLCERKLRGFPLRMRFYPGTYSGWFLFYRGLYEEGCVNKFRQLLRSGMTVVDVGANSGMYAIIASHCVGPSGRVLAVEPQENLGELIESNARLNGLSNIEVAVCALGTTPGAGWLHQLSPSNDGQATLALSPSEHYSSRCIVPMRVLPDLLTEHGMQSVSAMKIDVEGAELRILEGAACLFDVSRPQFVLFECIDCHLRRFGDSASALIRFFLDRSYMVYGLHRGKWRPVSSVADHLGVHETPDLLAVRA